MQLGQYKIRQVKLDDSKSNMLSGLYSSFPTDSCRLVILFVRWHFYDSNFLIIQMSEEDADRSAGRKRATALQLGPRKKP
jgi:hypothetical protein